MKRIFTVLLMSLFISMGWAQWDGSVATNFAAGDGSGASPFQIQTAAQLAYMQKYVADNAGASGVFFKLMSDINLSGGSSWKPIGNSTASFQGIFDGNGHVVSNMTISGISADWAGNGLFGHATNATIKKVGVNNYIISSDNLGNSMYIGGMIGYAAGTAIEECFAIGAINLTGSNGSNKIGGFIGRNEPNTNVIDCYSRSNIEVAGAVSEISDFAGSAQYGTYTNCFSYYENITNPGATGAINAFSGWSGGTYTNCYMNEHSKQYMASGVITKSEADFKSSDMVIALGTSKWNKDGASTINNGFPVLAWQGGTIVVPVTVTASTVGNGIVSGVGEHAAGESVTITAVADYGYTFSGWSGDATGTNNVWVINNIQSNKTLTATFVASSTTPTPGWNKSTITSAADLMAFSNAVNGGDDLSGTTITLTSDITLDKSMNWQPIGNETTAFAGTFDGNGKIINGLTIYNNAERQGLFGVVNGTIKNMSVVDAAVKANGRSAILVGHLSGASALVENCYVTGAFGIHTGGTDVGGIVGRIDNGGILQNCFSKATVFGTGGGTGAVAGTLEANSFVKSCYSTGLVISPEQYPAIVGYIAGTIENCYFDSETTGVSEASEGTTAATTAEMKSTTMVDNLNGASAPAMWKQDASAAINSGYPALSWQESVSTDLPKFTTKELIVYSQNGTVTITNATIGKPLSIVSITGVVHKTVVVSDSNMSFQLPRGIWIITDGTAVKKVMVN